MSSGNEKTDLIYANLFTGFGDGLIIPFIVGILSLAITSQSFSCIIFTAVAAILGAIAFGLARYFGELSEIEHNHPLLSSQEAAKENAMMEYIGIATELRTTMQTKIMSEKEDWLQEINENRLGWETINKKRALKAGIQTLSSFLTGGLITFLILSVILAFFPTFSLLFFLPTALPILILAGIAGGLKARFTGRNFFKGAIFSIVYGLFSLCMPALIAWILVAQS